MSSGTNPEIDLQACFSKETVQAVGEFQRGVSRATYQVMSVGDDPRTLVVTAYYTDDTVCERRSFKAERDIVDALARVHTEMRDGVVHCPSADE